MDYKKNILQYLRNNNTTMGIITVSSQKINNKEKFNESMKDLKNNNYNDTNIHTFYHKTFNNNILGDFQSGHFYPFYLKKKENNNNDDELVFVKNSFEKNTKSIDNSNILIDFNNFLNNIIKTNRNKKYLLKYYLITFDFNIHENLFKNYKKIFGYMLDVRDVIFEGMGINSYNQYI